jgi:hypothetical protein
LIENIIKKGIEDNDYDPSINDKGIAKKMKFSRTKKFTITMDDVKTETQKSKTEESKQPEDPQIEGIKK